MPEKEEPRSFAVLLHELGEGSLLSLLSAELQEVVSKCQDYALNEGAVGKGKVVLELDFAAEKNGTCAVRSTIKSKAPRPKLPPAAMWISKGGNLLIENPRQQRLALKDVNKRGEAKDLPQKEKAAE